MSSQFTRISHAWKISNISNHFLTAVQFVMKILDLFVYFDEFFTVHNYTCIVSIVAINQIQSDANFFGFKVNEVCIVFALPRKTVPHESTLEKKSVIFDDFIDANQSFVLVIFF